MLRNKQFEHPSWLVRMDTAAAETTDVEAVVAKHRVDGTHWHVIARERLERRAYVLYFVIFGIKLLVMILVPFSFLLILHRLRLPHSSFVNPVLFAMCAIATSKSLGMVSKYIRRRHHIQADNPQHPITVDECVAIAERQRKARWDRRLAIESESASLVRASDEASAPATGLLRAANPENDQEPTTLLRPNPDVFNQ